MTNFNIDSQSVNFDRRTALIGTGAFVGSALLLSKDVAALPIDPAISAYVNWRRAEDESFNSACNLEELEAGLPKLTTGWKYVTLGGKNEPDRHSSLLVTTHKEIDNLPFNGLSKEQAEDSRNDLRASLNKKIETRRIAENKIPGLEAAKTRVKRAGDNYPKCKQAIFAAVPTSILGATLKMNAIASYNIEETGAMLALQKEMLGMARLQGQHIEQLPVKLFDLRGNDPSYWSSNSNDA